MFEYSLQIPKEWYNYLIGGFLTERLCKDSSENFYIILNFEVLQDFKKVISFAFGECDSQKEKEIEKVIEQRSSMSLHSACRHH